MASGDLVPPNDSPISQAIEGECLPEAEAISWPQCFEILRANWAASPEEVCLWGANGAIRFYSPVPRDGAYPPAAPGYFDEPMDTSPWELLCSYKFNRAEVERFYPQNEALDGPVVSLAAAGKDRYWVAMHNPSGRHLSFDQAVAFLRGPSVGAPQDAPQIEAIIWSEVELKRIWPRNPFGHRTKFRKGLRDACFTEGSVLMLAREHWGVNLDRWDTASSPPAPSDDTGPDTTGMVAWQAATLEKWDEIENDFGRFPAARKVLTWLRQQGPRDVFPEEQPQARDTAEWLDRDGNRQTLTLKNLANRMSEWRQWGWIPSREK